jgi:predicted  nucleic acid-binding Zn-ribbon protein
MPEDRAADNLSRRLALYAYLERLLANKRVLEVGKAAPEGAEYLRSLGARVVTIEGDVSRVDERFDIVIVPESDGPTAAAVASWRRLLVDRGRLVVAAANPDRGGGSGVGYYDLHGALAPHFPNVQMLGLTPFLGMGVVEFDGTLDGLRIESRLVKDGPELPAAYVAVAGADAVPGLGYLLVQLPFASFAARLAGAAPPAPSAAVLREEVDELRGRLRRAADDRAALDAEVGKLRNALTEADQAVVNLTRKTADEMASLAARLAAGVRVETEPRESAELVAARDEVARLRVRLAEADARVAAAEQRLEEVGGATRERQTALEDALERLRLADSELSRARRHAAHFEEEARASTAIARGLEERDIAIAARDERIAKLESEKQELLWRLAELEDKLTDAIARAVRADSRSGVARPEARTDAAVSAARDEMAATREVRERALDQFHKAATVHVDEVTQLKASVSEQAALVAELEDALQVAEARAAAAAADAQALRGTAKDLEEADRSRRSRLAELEGKLLRLEHERRAQQAAGAADSAVVDLERELGAARAGVDELRRQLANQSAAWEHERSALRAELDQKAQHAPGRNGHDAPPPQAAHEAEPALDETASRLANTIGNYRQRAGRLRDELLGIRRRLDALSSSEIAGYLEELGDDLAELER